MKKERKRYDDDDGRVIAKMNVPGMPWYTPSSGENCASEGIDKSEERVILFGALKSALLVAAVFSLAMIGVAAFCVFVWFR